VLTVELRRSPEEAAPAEEPGRASEERESEKRYRLLFDATPLPVFVFDSESLRYLAVNEAALQKYGYSRDELMGMTVLDIRPEEDVQRLRETLATLAPMNLNTGSWRHRKKDGTTFEVEITTHAIEFGGRPARLVVANDVTERRRVDEQLRQSQRMEATGQLAGGVAHDFNNLLGVVLGAGELARHAARAGRPVEPYLAEIDAAAKRAADLTRKLLAFSRKQVLEVRTLDVSEMVDDFLQLIRRVIGEDVELVTVRSPEPLIVSADASQLEQVLLNLCTNARQAMPSGGRIVLETRRTRFDVADVQRAPWAVVGDWAELSLADDGEGMDEATRARVFEPFFTTKRDGTGLGLAMVHGIVHQHGGLVHVESRPAAGTTVRVYLPLAHEAIDAVPTPAPSNGAVVHGGHETLLVAEDEAPLRGLLALTLSELGYDVITASDGEEAVRTFTEQRGRISLAILDVVMPHLGGVQAFERMRALDPTLKVIFITGYAPQHAQVSRILENGGNSMLHKPFGLKDLGHAVRETLDGRA
jgi:PAS domain S-box-containing protein